MAGVWICFCEGAVPELGQVKELTEKVRMVE